MAVPTQDSQMSFGRASRGLPVWASVLAACMLLAPGRGAFGAGAAVVAPSAAACVAPQDWVGKYPADAIGPAGARFLDVPCVRAALKSMLSAADYRTFRERLAVDSPIQLMGRYLVIARCEAHNCPAHHAMLILDTQGPSVVIGIYRRASSTASTRWYSNEADPLELPPEILQRFLRAHSPK